MREVLTNILNQLLSQNLSCLNPENIRIVSEESMRIINKENLDEYDVENAGMIISISQIVYNNTDKEILFLDDGVYDLLLEKYKNYNINFQVGAPVIKFDQYGDTINQQEKELMSFVSSDPQKFIDNSLFYQDLSKSPAIDINILNDSIVRNSGKVISKRNINVPHKYPKLVGSLDKCKFVLNKEAADRGVFDDENVKIFERDFLGKHLQMGLINMDTPFELIAELKYDGVSVEADVTDKILSARSRGDANEDIAADLTDILGGYKFPYAVPLSESEAFGIKFEAIIEYRNLQKMSELRGKNYKNSRNGIIGLLGSSDAYDYRDLITLIPLATSIKDIDRVDEINFLNKYYNSGEYLRYAVLRGTYVDILFQVYKFVHEAEAMRNMLPFMYDGVVISYRDKNIINALGRENSINKYSVAIKFNPLIREAVFTGYSYTIGQDGIITPMIHYTPVEFYGTIHSKSSGHSYRRFQELNLAVGDIVQIEYTNDVMPYVTKSNTTIINNPNPPEQFPIVCPYCGSKIVFHESGKSAYCPNINCPERIICRIANMMDKLNIKDFGEETFRVLGTKSLTELLNYDLNTLQSFGLGPIVSEKLLDRINGLKQNSIYDYKIIGSLGFSGIAIETWKKILKNIDIADIVYKTNEELYNELVSIKGIGQIIANIIISERQYFSADLFTILNMENIIRSKGIINTGKIIRYSGCRPDDELSLYLESKGCDSNGNASVTKSTDILVVPYIGYNSSKVQKISENTIIVDMAEFRKNVDKYL